MKVFAILACLFSAAAAFAPVSPRYMPRSTIMAANSEDTNRADFLKQSFTAALGLATTAQVVNADVGVEGSPINYEKRNINPGSIIRASKGKSPAINGKTKNAGSILKK